MKNQRLLMKIVLLSSALLLPGCLSLCGKTTYISESPETIGRISTLENRLSALEQVVRPLPPEILPH